MDVVADRPEYVTCIRKPRGKHVWCGRASGLDFVFESLDHAAAAVETGTRLVPCPDCVSVATRVLRGEQPEP